MTARFAAATIARFERGDTVTLADGRDGYVVGRCFGITPGGAPRLEHYSVMLTGGRGRVSVRPEKVSPHVTDLKGAA